MSETVNIYDAKTRLSQLVDRASEGEEVIIARGGRPVARLVALQLPAVERKPGRLRGRVRISKTFDDPLPESFFEFDAE
ncbi:MAG: antitoxin [Acidobacteria bacterium]|jgi:prevent-host-death family protein|nr:antitoxin [Acidobacteriota bacterium]